MRAKIQQEIEKLNKMKEDCFVLVVYTIILYFTIAHFY